MECADPFPVAWKGRNLIFVEMAKKHTDRGSIGFVELFPDGRVSQPTLCLAEPHHLSYPFVMEEEGEHYMLPESFGARCVVLYRATEFPNSWCPERLLIQEDAIDPTIWFDRGMFWMWVGIMNRFQTAADQTNLYFAPQLKGPWQAHPQNPIVSDIRTARPAGRLFLHEGRLIRPSQDCSIRYGRRLVFNEVTSLSASEYSERPLRIAEPVVTWASGMHTYNRLEDMEVIDLCREEFVIRAAMRRLPQPSFARA
jgi:hypothetical protein